MEQVINQVCLHPNFHTELMLPFGELNPRILKRDVGQVAD
jgi:hypothetical protein